MEGSTDSVKKDSCAFLLIAFGVLIVEVFGGDRSFSLFLLTSVLQSNIFAVLVNDFLAAYTISGFTIYTTVLLPNLQFIFPSCNKVRRRLYKYCI